MHTERDHLTIQLKEIPAFRALIRSVEARLFSQQVLEYPVLDLGCGDGHFAASVFEEPLTVGIDVDHHSLLEAQRREAYQYLFNSSAESLPFANESFATVMANCAIEHVPNIDSLLDETSRVLRADGRFIFSVPNENFQDGLFTVSLFKKLGWRGLAARYARWFDKISFHYHRYSVEEWTRRLSEVGLRVVHWQYYFSPATTRVFELWHYLGLPSLIIRKLTGKWLLVPSEVNLALTAALLRPYYSRESTPPTLGSATFFIAQKR